MALTLSVVHNFICKSDHKKGVGMKRVEWQMIDPGVCFGCILHAVGQVVCAISRVDVDW
jgi:hypothetical protein